MAGRQNRDRKLPVHSNADRFDEKSIGFAFQNLARAHQIPQEQHRLGHECKDSSRNSSARPSTFKPLEQTGKVGKAGIDPEDSSSDHQAETDSEMTASTRESHPSSHLPNASDTNSDQIRSEVEPNGDTDSWIHSTTREKRRKVASLQGRKPGASYHSTRRRAERVDDATSDDSACSQLGQLARFPRNSSASIQNRDGYREISRTESDKARLPGVSVRECKAQKKASSGPSTKGFQPETVDLTASDRRSPGSPAAFSSFGYQSETVDLATFTRGSPIDLAESGGSDDEPDTVDLTTLTRSSPINLAESSSSDDEPETVDLTRARNSPINRAAVGGNGHRVDTVDLTNAGPDTVDLTSARNSPIDEGMENGTATIDLTETRDPVGLDRVGRIPEPTNRSVAKKLAKSNVPSRQEEPVELAADNSSVDEPAELAVDDSSIDEPTPRKTKAAGKKPRLVYRTSRDARPSLDFATRHRTIPQKPSTYFCTLGQKKLFEITILSIDSSIIMGQIHFALKAEKETTMAHVRNWITPVVTTKLDIGDNWEFFLPESGALLKRELESLVTLVDYMDECSFGRQLLVRLVSTHNPAVVQLTRMSLLK